MDMATKEYTTLFKLLQLVGTNSFVNSHKAFTSFAFSDTKWLFRSTAYNW